MRRCLSSGLFAIVLLFVVPACGDDDDEGTPITCVGVCERQNELCGETDDCQTLCGLIEVFNQQSGCTDEFQEDLECVAALDVCDDDNVCSGASSFACADAYCAENPTNVFCDSDS